MSSPDALFNKVDVGATLRAQEQKLAATAASIPADHALATSAEDLAAELVELFHIEPITLHEDALSVSHHDTKVDVSRDRMRVINDRSRPLFIPGTTVTYHVPFGGEADLFKVRPSRLTLSPPYAVVAGNEVQISETAPTPIPPGIKDRLDRTLTQIKSYLDTLNADVGAYNDRLPEIALAAVIRRRDKLIADHDLVASFGIPIRRGDAPKTYAAAPVRKTVTKPVAGKPGEPLEKALTPAVYEDILSITRQMAAVMERSPKAFATMGEDDLRQHFLVQLNGQYEGDATGETFNFEGKTDILIRREGRNTFIAECKFWSGPKKLTETIDQILRYTSWRDTKTAILVFNRGRELSKVLAQISPTVAAHPSFVREIPYGGETDFRFTLHHRNDPERELTLTILVFEVPG